MTAWHAPCKLTLSHLKTQESPSVTTWRLHLVSLITCSVSKLHKYTLKQVLCHIDDRSSTFNDNSEVTFSESKSCSGRKLHKYTLEPVLWYVDHVVVILFHISPIRLMVSMCRTSIGHK